MLGLNTHQLHLFLTVTKKGSFSAAATALHMTQPAITMQIQSLEEYLGVKLFIRSHKRVELTEAGRVLLPYAEQSLQITSQAETAIAQFVDRLKGRLLVGASLTIGEHILPEWLGMFSMEHPDMAIHMHVWNTSQLIDSIASHALDLALVEAPVVHTEIASEVVMQDELVLVLPAGHPLLEYEQITVADLRPFPWIMREPGSGTRSVLEDALTKVGESIEHFHIRMSLGSTTAIKTAVERQLGISFLSSKAIIHEEKLGLLHTRKLEGLRLPRQFYAIYSKSMKRSYPATCFLHFLRSKGEFS